MWAGVSSHEEDPYRTRGQSATDRTRASERSRRRVKIVIDEFGHESNSSNAMMHEGFLGIGAEAEKLS